MKIGVLGAGKISHSTVPAMVALEEVECWAVASRSLEKAQAFAEKYGFRKAYGSYEEMLNDPEVELVYVATPHSHHAEHMKLCINHGKPILCEKAFTGNARQAEEVLNLAREKGVFVAEAIWTRYMPSRNIINELLESEHISLSDDKYSITEKGRRNSADCESSLSVVIRKRCDRRLAPLNAQLRRNAQIQTSIQETQDGTFVLNLSLDDDMGNLMDLSLTAVSQEQCEQMAKRFQAQPEQFYRTVLAALLPSEE
jgi:hypothetical protein